MAHKQTPESSVMDAVCEYLHMMGYFFFRVNNVGVYDPVKKIHRKLPKWAIKGVSDLIVVWRGQTFFIELKAPKGKLSPDQEAFQASVENNDGDYHVVRSVEDIQQLFPRRA